MDFIIAESEASNRIKTDAKKRKPKPLPIKEKPKKIKKGKSNFTFMCLPIFRSYSSKR